MGTNSLECDSLERGKLKFHIMTVFGER